MALAPDRDAHRARLGRLLVSARDGDRASLDELIAALNPLLWHVARSQGLATDDAADAVQMGWLELLRSWQSIRNPESVAAWLVTAVRRESWRVRELGRRDIHGLDVDVTDPGPGLDASVLADERDQALWAHVATLSTRCQALLRVVAQVHRPDYDDIAQSLGMPRGSIGPTRGRCLAQLRRLLDADTIWSTP